MFLLEMEGLKIVRYWKANKVDVQLNTEYKFERKKKQNTEVKTTKEECQDWLNGGSKIVL